MLKLTLIFALLAVTGSALAQVPVWPGESSSLWLNARRLTGPLPQSANTLQILDAPVLSVPTNMIQVVGADCGTLGRSSTVLSNTMRFAVFVPSWDQSALSVSMLMSSCSNEPNHSINFSLRAASIANNADLTSPVFGSYVYVTNALSGANLASLVSFPSLTPGNAGTTSQVVLIELGRVADQFTNALAIAQVGLSYGKVIY